jgi:hypothetical protein
MVVESVVLLVPTRSRWKRESLMANKFVFLPPQSDVFRQWIPRLIDSVTGWDIVTPQTVEDAKEELAQPTSICSERRDFER